MCVYRVAVLFLYCTINSIYGKNIRLNIAKCISIGTYHTSM